MKLCISCSHIMILLHLICRQAQAQVQLKLGTDSMSCRNFARLIILSLYEKQSVLQKSFSPPVSTTSTNENEVCFFCYKTMRITAPILKPMTSRRPFLALLSYILEYKIWVWRWGRGDGDATHGQLAIVLGRVVSWVELSVSSCLMGRDVRVELSHGSG